MSREVWVKGDKGVECYFDKEEKALKVLGELGECKQIFKGEDIEFISENTVKIKSKASLGYFLSRVKSLVEGVSKGYYVELEVVGRGYRFINLTGRLLLKLGSVHYIDFAYGEGVQIVGTRTRILIFGLDYEEVKRIGSVIRNFKVPDAYKGKGIRYIGENIKLKVGKKS